MTVSADGGGNKERCRLKVSNALNPQGGRTLWRDETKNVRRENRLNTFTEFLFSWGVGGRRSPSTQSRSTSGSGNKDMDDITNKKIKVQIRKVTFSKDGLIYVSIGHPLAKHVPTLVFDKEAFEKLKELIIKHYENEEKN